MKKGLILVIALLAVVVALASCKKKNVNEVHVFNWSEYIPDSVLVDFEKETGIKVVYTTYDSNEAMYAKLKILNGAGYDVTVPSTYYLDKMRDEGLIQKLDHTKLQYLNDILPMLLDQSYDPKNEYSLPFMWGTSGIAVNTKYINPDNVTSWKDLWRPEFKGYVMLQNDSREVFHIALRTLGFSGNSLNKKEISKAYEELKKLSPSVRLYNSDSPKVPFINEEVYVGHIFCGEAYMAARENPNIKYVYPKEGVIVWVDSFVIPSKAKNIDNAYTFINYISRPDVSAKISEQLGYSSPSLKARELLPDEVKNNRTVYPEAVDMINSEFQLDVGDEIVTYEKYWEKLKGK